MEILVIVLKVLALCAVGTVASFLYLAALVYTSYVIENWIFRG